MKGWFASLVVLSALPGVSSAQSLAIIERLKGADSTATVFYLPAGTQMEASPWRDSIYRFSSFETGTLTFSTGYSPPHGINMNYNLYFVQMDYISSSGDTLQMKPLHELQSVSIGEQIFYYDQKTGYIEIIQKSQVALGVRWLMKAYQVDQRAGMNAELHFNPFDLRGTSIEVDRYYTKDGDYFFIDKNNSVSKATRASILKLFRDHKSSVVKYIDEHQVDFNDEAHLKSLLLYCSDLH